MHHFKQRINNTSNQNIMSTVEQFLAKQKQIAENKATEMAKLELSVWNQNHESELKANFGFTDKTLAQRKKQLSKTSK